MKTTLFLLLVLVGFIQISAGRDATYAVYFPKHIRPGFPIQMVVEILKSENPVKITASFQSPAKEIDYMLETNMSEGDNKMLVFNEVVPMEYTGTTDFEFSISGVDTVTEEVLFENSTSDLAYERKSLSIFIQTDKAIYKRGQTIKFRAVVVTPDLLPYSGKVTYKLTDPDSNIIVQETNAELMSGVVGSEFTLGRYAVLGDWKLSYLVLEQEESLILSVEEYKLPKFEVEVLPDRSFLDPTMKSYTGKIKADFTFGQPVKGTATLKIERQYYSGWGQTNTGAYHQVYENFNGEAEFDIPLDSITQELNWDIKNEYLYSETAKVTAIVEDKNSLVKLNKSITLHLEPSNIKVEQIATPTTIKPGLRYVAYLKVTEFDGRLLSEQARKTLGMAIQVQHSYPYISYQKYVPPVSELMDVMVREDGLVIFSFTAKNDNFTNVAFQVKMSSSKILYWTNWNAQRFESPSETFIQVTTDQTDMKIGDEAKLDIRTTKKANSYSIMILARGKLVKRVNFVPETYVEENESFKFQYRFPITQEMSPSLSFVVSFVETGGEIVSDTITLGVQSSLANKVTIETSTERTETGKPVDITVHASPDSYIGMRAIDKSVLLLKEGNDITLDKVLDDLDKYKTTSSTSSWPRFFFCYIPMDGKNAKDVFQKSGILVFTDGGIYSEQQSEPTLIFDDMMIMEAAMDNGVVAFDNAPRPGILYKEPTTSSSNEPKVRKDFPETWIWEHSTTDETGSRSFSYTLPDTATTWELSSFAVSPVTGLGVSEENAQIIATRNFFISLELPATIVRGETLNMRTTVYNYFDTEVLVTLTLVENDWYDLELIGNDTEIAGTVRKFEIPAKDGHTVVYPIKFKKSGMSRIKVVALSELAGDAVERTLRVKPEGIPQDKAHGTLIEMEDSESSENVVVSFPVEIPSWVVEGSTFVKISVSGNIMGNALSNLGNLLRVPTGCGEQTMIAFAPDVFVSIYLKKVGQLVGEVATKSRSHIQQGYSNELRYQLSDGGFSAFQSDTTGSTWLTAFVVKSFIAATQLSSDYIAKDRLDKAVGFMMKYQNKEGIFDEPGMVRHQDMQGGVNAKETMTAYVIISMIEGGYYKDDEKVSAAVEQSKNYLEKRWKSVDETFSLAIIAYALSLAESSEAVKIVNVLNGRTEVVKNLQFWTTGKSDQKHCGDEGFTCTWTERTKATATDIEITSYVLLTLIKLEYESGKLMPVVRWLTEQRGSFGGYCSTQDTVMAIQALSVFAGMYSASVNDMRLDITHSNDDMFAMQFHVNEENSMVLQSTEVPGVSGDVVVTATGVGIADVQVIYQYNVPSKPRAEEPFTVNIKVKEVDNGDVLEVTICSSINPDVGLEETGMYVVTMELLSGYTVDDKKASKMNKNAKLVELVNDEVSGYFDQIHLGDNICFDLSLERFAKISGVKPQSLRAFNYYKPGEMTYRTYSPPHYQDVCEVCGSACDGCGKGFTTKASILLLSVLAALAGVILQM
ncbi:CD109 antigen-like [Styela clava]